jgi:hypothetical protein
MAWGGIRELKKQVFYNLFEKETYRMGRDMGWEIV